ncbi:MAG TPA: Ni/Fe hydrogenase subunit alpha [Candidatus Omnitrophica bacterium]|nr:Ni/Fe hydrogenase subunit alpha [Candidatus Omnitrophota bacterium]
MLKKSKSNMDIEVKYLTRVEGHGNIMVKVKDGKLLDCRFEVIESPRFFESMLVGRSIYEAQHITSRICGICACGHTLASIKAGEAALGVKVSKQTKLLRQLLLHAETMDSHVLHFYILIAPDLLGVNSIFPLIKTHRSVIEIALRMKKMSDYTSDVLAGRHVHPISFVIGGLTKLPAKKTLLKLRKMMTDSRVDYEATVAVFKTLKFPKFIRPTQYVSLKQLGTYAYLDGDIYVSSTKKNTDPQKYLNVVNEFIRDYSTAKFASIKDESYAVGALARFNNSYKFLHPAAKKAAKSLGLSAPSHNPYLNTVAQLVEWRHCLEESIKIIDELLDKGLNEKESLVTSWPSVKKRPIKVKPGRGVGAVEVPRGTLYHDYTVDKNGIITHANCIIPTAQNLFNLENDMKELVPQLFPSKTKKEIQLNLEMLARAYDPCISCSTHLLEVEFV